MHNRTEVPLHSTPGHLRFLHLHIWNWLDESPEEAREPEICGDTGCSGSADLPSRGGAKWKGRVQVCPALGLQLEGPTALQQHPGFLRNLHDRPVVSKEIESVIKKSKMPQHRKLQSQMASLVNSSSHIKNQYNLPLANTEEEGTIALIYKYIDTKTRWGYKKIRLVSLLNIDTEILLANQIQEHIKRIIYHDQMGLIPSM